MAQKHVLAVDFGASSGRVLLGKFDGSLLDVHQVHRFSNEPVILGDTMYWDFLRLFYEIKQGLLKAKGMGPADSIGVDTWGVDYGLIDSNGQLLGNPIHYRDSRTAGTLQESFKYLDKKTFYQVTGNQFMEINTAFQLMAAGRQMPETLKQAKTLLLMPDLFRYFLSGEMGSEYSIASTTQLFHMREKRWAVEVMDKLGISRGLFQPLISSGTYTGKLRAGLIEELGITQMNVTAVAGHDTQSALAAVPAKEEDFLFISCGTWSLVGTERKEPVIGRLSQQYNLTNELGMEGRYSFLKNITGLWIVQESRRQWIREGREYSFDQMEELALKVNILESLIDPDAPEFLSAGNVPERIQSACQRTGQPVPATVGELVCCMNQSLALAYRKALEEIQECTETTYDKIYIIGGGTNSRLLCQMTANACGVRVIAGPTEATALGNAMAQYLAAGEFSNLSQARACLTSSVSLREYEPQDTEQWNEAYQKFLKMERN